MTRRAAALLAAGAGTVVALAAGAPVEAQGCAMCRTALTHSPEGRAVAESFNHAILLMLAAPYAVFATCAAYVLRRHLAAGLRSWRARFANRLASPAAARRPA